MSAADGDAALYSDQGLSLWIVNSIFIGLATLAVIGRFLARKLRKLPLAADDWAILIALLLDWILYGLFIACRSNGLGKHRATVPGANVLKTMELLYYFQISYILAPPAVKLSLLFLYRRIFVSSRFLITVYSMGALIAAWAIIMTFLGIFNCKPISAFWTGQGECLPFRKFAVGYAVVNIVTDLAVWLMPIPSMWKLQLPRGQKVALTLIFTLGLFDCAAALVRLLSSMLALGNWDITYDYARGFMWSIIEVSIAIVCTCLPTMRILLRTILHPTLARALGFPSSSPAAPNPPSHAKRPWVRSAEYNELEGSWMVRDGGSYQSRSDVSTGKDGVSENGGGGGIRVLEEVRIELRAMESKEGTGV